MERSTLNTWGRWAKLAILMTLVALALVLAPTAARAEDAADTATETETEAEEEALTLDQVVISSATSSGTKVTIKWSAVDNATSYLVLRATRGSDGTYGGYEQIATTTKTSYTDTDVALKTTYRYRIQAAATDGTGATVTGERSDYAKLYLLNTPTIKSVTGSPSKVKITWGKITSATTYYVYRATKSSDGTVGSYKKIATTTSTSYTDTTAKAKKTYRYKIQAVKIEDGQTISTSSKSPYRSIIVLGTPTIKSVSGYENRVTVKWGKVTSATRYYVYRATKKSDGSYGSYKKIATTTSTSYTDTSATASKTYRYKVRAVRGSSGNGNLSTSTASGYKTIKKVRQARLVIVGECYAVGMRDAGSYGSNVKFVAKTGMSTTAILNNGYLDDAVAYNPDRIIFICGMNEAYTIDSPTATVNRYREIIEALQDYDSDLEIVIMALPWVSGSYKSRNTYIQKYNKQLKALCAEYDGVYYYSAHRTTLKSSSGNYLAAKYNGGDGMHWTATAYKIVLADLLEWNRTI